MMIVAMGMLMHFGAEEYMLNMKLINTRMMQFKPDKGTWWRSGRTFDQQFARCRELRSGPPEQCLVSSNMRMMKKEKVEK